MSRPNPVIDLTNKKCPHYKNRCSVRATCCDIFYPCWRCHDEIFDPMSKSNHEIIKSDIYQIICDECLTIQSPGSKCTFCDIIFGKYTCVPCAVYDDTDLGQFHCEKCGICRKGEKENYVHCDNCKMCLSKSMMNVHSCGRLNYHQPCPSCYMDMASSQQICHEFVCGHIMHTDCYVDMLKAGKSTCPVCLVTVIPRERMQMYWDVIEREIALCPMPVEYADRIVKIICNDCLVTFETKWHIIGHKCSGCGSFNTSMIEGK
jgi:RING finger/CHY zinc finger protein 1